VLWNDPELSIGVPEGAVHIGVSSVDVNGYSAISGCDMGRQNRDDSGYEIGRIFEKW
jgi:hypothetical protein